MVVWAWLASAWAQPSIILETTEGTAPPAAATKVFRDAPRKNPEAFRALGLDRVWRVPVREDAEVEAQRWAEQPGVRWAEVDLAGSGAATPNDPYYSNQWGLSNDGTYPTGAVAGGDIQAEDAWDVATGSGQIIAVLDSGINAAEPDISNQLWTNPGEDLDGADTDGNGYIDDVAGWDFAYEDNIPTDAFGHGSNVASVAAASGNNGVGIAGVCWNCVVMPVQVLNDDDFGFYSWWAEAVTYAVDNDADVINMSLQGTGTSNALCNAVAYAESSGVPVFAAMGNWDASTPSLPAVCGGAIAIGATSADDTRSSPFVWGGGSNFGSHIHTVAPGNQVHGHFYTNVTNYGVYYSGTSQASPHAAGVAALLLSVAPNLTVTQIRDYLANGAEDQVGRPTEDTAGWDQYHGHGRINAAASLSLLQADFADDDLDGVTVVDGDCDDANADVFPGAEEACDEVDSNCDGSLVDAFADTNADGVPDCITDADEDGFTPNDGDCDDANPAAFPDADETCDEVDEDCDGVVDNDPVDPSTGYVDADGDGVGAGEEMTGCIDGLVPTGGDCDDADAALQANCDDDDDDDDKASSGCGCSLGGGSPSPWGAGLLGVVALAGFGRRRRQR